MPGPGTTLAKTNFQESQRLLLLRVHTTVCSQNVAQITAAQHGCISQCGVGIITHRLVISDPSDRASRRKSQGLPLPRKCQPVPATTSSLFQRHPLATSVCLLYERIGLSCLARFGSDKVYVGLYTHCDSDDDRSSCCRSLYSARTAR
jgi:hypothetical protein